MSRTPYIHAQASIPFTCRMPPAIPAVFHYHTDDRYIYLNFGSNRMRTVAIEYHESTVQI